MRYFLDCEFIEDGNTIDLISIALVAEDDRILYLQKMECNFTKASEWVRRNVFPHLKHFDTARGGRACSPFVAEHKSGLCGVVSSTRCGSDCPWATTLEIQRAVLAFCDPSTYGEPEFWGYYADYDWVAFCQLFGTMMQLPRGFPMYCRDIKQFCDFVGNPKLPAQSSTEHNALADAAWNKEAFRFLVLYMEENI